MVQLKVHPCTCLGEERQSFMLPCVFFNMPTNYAIGFTYSLQRCTSEMSLKCFSSLRKM